MFNKLLLSVIGVLIVLLGIFAMKSYVDSSRLESKQEKVEKLESIVEIAPLDLDVAVIAATATGEIDQLNKEVLDENITYDVGIFSYVFD